jgi:hypothetical protein
MVLFAIAEAISHFMGLAPKTSHRNGVHNKKVMFPITWMDLSAGMEKTHWILDLWIKEKQHVYMLFERHNMK